MEQLYSLKQTVYGLHTLQMIYLDKLLENITDEHLYSKQLEGYNSAGWILGHLCVEIEDIFTFLSIPFTSLDPVWNQSFRNNFGRIKNLENLPSKQDLIKVLKERYFLLLPEYMNLSDEILHAPCPSKMLAHILPTIDAWIVHHLTTHIAIHCGNLVVWKKLVGLDVNGF